MCSTSSIECVLSFAGIARALAMFACSPARAVAPVNCRNLRRSMLVPVLLIKNSSSLGLLDSKIAVARQVTGPRYAGGALSHLDDSPVNFVGKDCLRCVTESEKNLD